MGCGLDKRGLSVAVHINFLDHRGRAAQRHRAVFWRDLRWTVSLTLLCCVLAGMALDRSLHSARAAAQEARDLLLIGQQTVVRQERVEQAARQLQAKHAMADEWQGPPMALARLWGDLATGLADGSYLTEVRIDAQGVLIQGRARSEQDVLALNTYLSERSQRWQAFKLREFTSPSSDKARADAHFVVEAAWLPEAAAARVKP